MLKDSEISSINRGREIAQMSLQNSGYVAPVSYRQMSSETHEGFATIQQVTNTFFYCAYLIIVVLCYSVPHKLGQYMVLCKYLSNKTKVKITIT